MHVKFGFVHNCEPTRGEIFYRLLETICDIRVVSDLPPAYDNPAHKNPEPERRAPMYDNTGTTASRPSREHVYMEIDGPKSEHEYLAIMPDK